MSHPNNAELIEAIWLSQLSYTNNPKSPEGKFWELPEPALRFDSIKQAMDANYPVGLTLVLTHDNHYLPAKLPARRHDGGVPFKPFQLHEITQGEDGSRTSREIARAFWTASGTFSIHGRINEKLGGYFYKLIRKIAARRNWRGYSYRDALEELAIEYLCRYGLNFDHRHALNNPTGYYNKQIQNAFIREVQKQARHHHYDSHLTTQHLGNNLTESLRW